MERASISLRIENPIQWQICETSKLPIETICAPISKCASLRRMQYQLLPATKLNVLTPTQRFMQGHPVYRINSVLINFGMTEKDLALFKKMIAQEDKSFLGYHAGSSTVRLFQDMIGIVVKDILQLPVKDDFIFTRVPGDPIFHYDNAADFLHDMRTNIPAKYWDNQPQVRQHILSMNMNLYQSYDYTGNFTPRYFLENMTWTDANVKELIKPFFKSVGIEESIVDILWSKALDFLPHDRGYILQFFDRSENFSFTREHAYIAQSGGRPHPRYPNHEILFDDSATSFPQIRLVLSNESTLNPFSSLDIKRYDGMTDLERSSYESSLRELIGSLHYDQSKVKEARERLLQLWLS